MTDSTYQSDYYKKNCEKIKARQREYAKQNREQGLARTKAYYLNNKEKLKDKSKQWYAVNKERARATVKLRRTRDREKITAASRFKKTGFTPELFAERMKAQAGKCAICSCELKQPAADHNHKTGQQRGILCRACNTGIGIFKENCAVLEQAILYLMDWGVAKA